MSTIKNTSTEDTTDREIIISRVLDAPRELAWEAMTNPLHVVNWWGPRGFTTTIEEMDVRVGGAWNLVMHGPDGTDYPNQNIFKEVTKPERLVFSKSGGRKGEPGMHFESTWTFDKLADGKTKVTIHMVFSTAADRDRVVKEYGAIEGGKQTLARLSEELPKMPVVVERSYDAPAELVWKAITDVDHMRQWYFPNLDAFKPEVGSQTKFNIQFDGKEFLHLWKVTDVVAGKKISYSWKYGGYPGDSVVTFELFAEGDKTTIRLTHEGLESFLPETNPDLVRGNFVMGWTQFIGTKLKEFVEQAALKIEPEFIITRVFDAPRDLVWAAWTEPKQLAQWWGPRTFTNRVCELDVRPGGAYRIVMRGPDGTEYPIKGVYREISPPERLVITMDCTEHPAAWHDQINPNRQGDGNPAGVLITTVTFESVAEKTMLTVHMRFESSTIRDSMVKMGMNEGWSQSLDKLSQLVSRLA